MALILGISAFYHDSAVALISDGEIVAAASEERFTRKKNDSRFPSSALEACLRTAGAAASDIDYVAFYEKPLLKFDRLLATYLAFAPTGYRSFAKAMPQWLSKKLYLRREICRRLKQLSGNKAISRRIIFGEHHESHAASAFYPSPFDQAAVITLDGVGEWATASWGVGEGQQLRLHAEHRFPHSLGLLYSAITYFCGFRVNSGEYKLMGLAPYGQPRYSKLLEDHVIKVANDGSFRMNMRYFEYCQGLRMTSRNFNRLIGHQPRKPDAPLRQVDLDLAASIQTLLENIVLKTAMHVHQRTGQRNLCLAGGVALNCVANGRLRRETPFDNIWVQPASGDAGGALGVALLVHHNLMNQKRVCSPTDSMFGALLGPTHDFDAEVNQLVSRGAVCERFSVAALDQQIARLLDEGQVIGWVQGRMEFGPRALGNRSILADARRTDTQAKVNQQVKFRESFRPFAPAVLEQFAKDYFDIIDPPNPYMLFTCPVARSRRQIPPSTSPQNTDVDTKIHALVRQSRSDIPAVTHVDYSARVQSVTKSHHPRFFALLSAFHERTGCPLLVNTSFNVRGEPIVYNAEDAYRCFLATKLDALVIDRWLFLRHQQPSVPQQTPRQVD